jgi:hypothetical protein
MKVLVILPNATLARVHLSNLSSHQDVLSVNQSRMVAYWKDGREDWVRPLSVEAQRLKGCRFDQLHITRGVDPVLARERFLPFIRSTANG